MKHNEYKTWLTLVLAISMSLTAGGCSKGTSDETTTPIPSLPTRKMPNPEEVSTEPTGLPLVSAEIVMVEIKCP